MGDDEHVVGCKMIYDIVPEHNVVYIFENGKGLRVSMKSYEAKTKRKKITGACSSDSPLVGAIYEGDKPVDIFIKSDAGRGMIVKSSLIPLKATRTAGGNQIMQLPKRGVKVEHVTDRISDYGKEILKCRKSAIPSSGSSLAQMTFNL
jgi:DNA gyrase subunit A